MNLKFFPVTITSDGRKVPLIKNWQTEGSDDPAQFQLWKELFRDRLTHWGVATGPRSGLLVLDIDTKTNGFESVQKYGLQIPLTASQVTLSGGRHYVFHYPQDGNHYKNRVGIYPGVDVRGDGGYIVYYGFDNTGIAPAPAWLLSEALKTAPEPQGETIAFDPTIAEGIVKDALQAIYDAPVGERNNTLNRESFRIGQLVASGSLSHEYATQILTQAANAIGLNPHEIKGTVASGIGGGTVKPVTAPFGAPTPIIEIPAPPMVERWTPNYFTVFDLNDTSKLRRPQLFKDWSTCDIHITTADGGTGKTTLKLYEAICLALGVPFLGFQCLNPGKTLFITGEDTREKLGAMLGAITRQMNLTNEQVQTVLASVVVKKDSDLCLITKDRQGFLHPNQDAMRKLLEAIEDIKPKMIVLDPIAAFWGSEAALNDMAKAVIKFVSELVDKSGACVEMINHMGKKSSSEKDMSQFAGRGGTGLPSHARVSRVLRPISSEEFSELAHRNLEENQSAILCNVNKFSDGSPLWNKEFVILREGYLFSRIVIDSSKVREEKQSESDIERVLNFVKDMRVQKIYPTRPVIVAHFMTIADKLSEARVKRAVDLLTFLGHEGLKLKPVAHPDATITEKAFVITNVDGEEQG